MAGSRISLAGRVALVTGATSGLGRAVATRLAAEGADVALIGRSEEDLRRSAHDVRAHGVRAEAFAADLARTDELASVVDRVVSRLGPPVVLVNAAATDTPGPVDELPLAEWERVVAVNLTAPFALARAVLPHMRAAGGGLVVNVSSVAGRRGWAGAAAYCATKSALTGLTQSLAADGREDGVRACVLYPGAMDTNWGTFDDRPDGAPRPPTPDNGTSLAPEVVADLIAWMATSPGRPVLNEGTITPLLEQGWP